MLVLWCIENVRNIINYLCNIESRELISESYNVCSEQLHLSYSYIKPLYEQFSIRYLFLK